MVGSFPLDPPPSLRRLVPAATPVAYVCCWAAWSYGQEIQTLLFTSGYAPAMSHSVSCLPPRSRPYSLSIGAGLTDVEREMGWKKLLSYITGSVDQELLLRNEYLVTENRMLRQ